MFGLKKLSEDEKAFVREYVAEGIEEDDRKARRREMASEFGVTLKKISAITAWTTIRAKKGSNGSVKNAQQDDDTFEDISENTDSEKANGAHFNYQNPVKEAWREKVREFIIANTSAKERARMKALLLPGKDCAEAKVFLDMGFERKNIVGVEGGDKKARKEFKENAEKLGIDYRLGRLENVLPKDPTAYGVVSLDFLGQLCDSYRRIFQQLHLETRALLLTNMMARRETRESQFKLKSLLLGLDKKSSGAMEEPIDNFDAQGLMRTMSDLFGNFSLQGLSKIRDKGAWIDVCANVGIGRDEVRPYPILRDAIQPVIRFSGTSTEDALAINAGITETFRMGITPSIQSALERTYPNVENAKSLSSGMFPLLSYGLGQGPSILVHKPYVYESEAGSKKLPYFSDFFVLEGTKTKLTEIRHSLKLLLEMLVEFTGPENGINAIEEAYITDNNHTRYTTPQREMFRSDTLFVRFASGKIFQTTLGRLLSDLKRCQELGNKGVFGDALRESMQSEREVIKP